MHIIFSFDILQYILILRVLKLNHIFMFLLLHLNFKENKTFLSSFLYKNRKFLTAMILTWIYNLIIKQENDALDYYARRERITHSHNTLFCFLFCINWINRHDLNVFWILNYISLSKENVRLFKVFLNMRKVFLSFYYFKWVNVFLAWNSSFFILLDRRNYQGCLWYFFKLN